MTKSEGTGFTATTSLTRRDTIRGAAALGLTTLAAPAYVGRAWAAKSIKIGFVSPQTGPIAAFGSADEFVVSEIQSKHLRLDATQSR